MCEWIAQLASDYEIHIYSQRVEDVDLSLVRWHRIPKLGGPHLFAYLWWFAANQAWRWRDRRFRGLAYDLAFSPGVNCLDADAVSVHVIFGEYVERVREELSLRRNSPAAWPRLLHRRLYYRLIRFLESCVYRRAGVTLILIARHTAAGLRRLYAREEEFPVIYVGLDHATFNPACRLALRHDARGALGIAGDRFVLLLVGNDWRNKGVPVLLEALALLRDLPVDLLVAGSEDPTAMQAAVAARELTGRVRAVPHRKDVEFYYAAADAYAGPSLEDTFAQPPAEAMACGLPVIVSAANGTSEIITHGQDGLVLADSTDAHGLAAMICRLYEDHKFARQLGDCAAATARKYTWERNGRELAAVFEGILRRKSKLEPQPAAQES